MHQPWNVLCITAGNCQDCPEIKEAQLTKRVISALWKRLWKEKKIHIHHFFLLLMVVDFCSDLKSCPINTMCNLCFKISIPLPSVCLMILITKGVDYYCFFPWCTITTFSNLYFVSMGPGGGVLPYICYTGVCRWIGYGFQCPLS